MLNYIWLSLIVIGVFVAVAYDVSDFWKDTYRNGQPLEVALAFDRPVGGTQSEISCRVYVSRNLIEDFYGVTVPAIGDRTRPDSISAHRGDTLVFQGSFKPARPSSLAGRNGLAGTGGQAIDRPDRPSDGGKPGDSPGHEVGVLKIIVGETAPVIWKEMAKAQGGNSNSLKGQVDFAFVENSPGIVLAQFVADPIKFVKLNKVTNEGAIRYAKIAVEIAIGLIGIMALWLGVMKIAEQSGLIAKIAQGLRPVMTRLFPDVPADHPAMGAMIMNIAANVLGLANAATPLGLKAMEELNRLNKKMGTATDAMCTFLVINTSNVQLIPATVIAIRAASGSGNPTEILGAVIVATSISTIVGVATVKLLAKLPGYRRQLEKE